MKFSKQWLAEYLDLPETSVLVEQLTMAGLEVDAVEAAAAAFSGVVVGEIISAQQHPDADKLKVCLVQGTEAEPVQVVCGAANAQAGLKVPFAQVGARLPGDFKIKKAKLRGQESLGMLCAAEELGLAESSGGILELLADAPVGEDFRQYMQLDDECIEIDLTPNRGDCLSLVGLAREVGVLNQKPSKNSPVQAVPAVHTQSMEVALLSPADCPRYASRIIKNIDNTQASPLWLQEKLRRSGIRSIDAVVDVTNFVLLELGQPMHAFDLDKIKGPIQVRHAQAAEKIDLLDEQSIELKNKELVIADDQRALALAGIMGGKHSAVQTTTKNILLEAAFFTPTPIAGRARSLGLHTDSSHRFERGVDYELPAQAIERATQLLLEIVGGEAGPTHITDSTNDLPKAKHIELRQKKVSSILGVEIAAPEIENILSGLGFSVQAEQRDDGMHWQVTVPSWRFDVAIEADLLEELARIYGYSRLPVTSMSLYAQLQPLLEELREARDIEHTLLQRGYHEAISYSFISHTMQQEFDPQLTAVQVHNPISSDMSVMRTSLLPGLLQTLKHNIKRQQTRVRIFEQGLCFLTNNNNEVQQSKKIAGLLSGSRMPENWTQKSESVDFFDIKADVEALLGADLRFTFTAAKHPALHPGQCAQILDHKGQTVGVVGALHPQLLEQHDLSSPVMVFELLYTAIEEQQLPSFQPVSKFPEVRRDLAFLLPRDTQVGDLLQTVKNQAGDSLKDLLMFDNYQGSGIDSTLKSIAIGLIFRKFDTTLTTEEVNKSVDTIIRSLKDNYGALLRD